MSRKRKTRGHSPGRRGSDAGRRARGRRPLSRAKLRRRLQLAGGLIFVLAVVAALWWVASQRERDFAALAREGRGELQERVVTEPSAGRAHVAHAGDYEHRFPTSGAHNPTWVDPGVYTRRQSRGRLVHALEHGNIVIYYDDPPAPVLERLRAWAGIYDGQWSGIVLVPAAGLDESIVLTAWTRRLVLDEFRPEIAAAFIDAYRGRGPENPVR